MIIKILVIFLITFTPINTVPCKENPTCECSSTNSDEINIVCNENNNTGYTVNIKSRNSVEIICKNWRTWENFYIKGRLYKNILKSLSFEKCGLSNKISLKEVVKQLGVTETQTLIFQSFKSLYSRLKRHHIEGFQSVKSLVLSDNGLTTISNDLFLDFHELEYIDLSNNSCDLPVDIFNGTPNLRRIILVSSGIKMIHVGTFNQLIYLEFLNIMSNNLIEIEEGTFDKLVSLTSLNLANNLLSKLPSTILHDVNFLEKLDISRNNFSSIPPNLFEQNRKLRELCLHNNINKMSTLPDNFLANLTKLQHVYLNNNGFIFLPENLFWGSSSLEYIFLNDNSFVTLPKNIFRGLHNVRKLLLQNNKIETLTDKIFEDMEQLRVLDLSNNLMVHLTGNLLYGLVSLHVLNMERNQLQIIDRQSLFPLINLVVAKFSHNPLKLFYTPQKLSIFYTNQYLEELHLSNTSLFNFFSDWMSDNINLKLLDLSHNFFTNVTATSFLLPSHKITIDLRYNNITNIHFDQIEEMVAWRWEKRNISINLEHNPLLCDCPLYDLLRYHERKMSPHVYNYFNIIMGNLTCVKPDETNEIEISKLNSNSYECPEHEYFKTIKKCQNNCTCSVRPSDKTRILDCSYKNMSEFLIDETRVIFERYNPFILNLAGNFLTEIPLTEHLYPLKITGLLLSNNNISTITLDKLPNSLKVLELHNNNISRIFFHEMNYLKSIVWEKFTLSGNPIVCDCSNRDLIKFVNLNRVSYEDLNNLKCESTHLPIDEISIDELCSSHLQLHFIYCILAVILVTVVIVIVFNIKKIRSWVLRHRAGHSFNFNERDTEE